jgi:membrane protease YdiL (CAAX protease family)
MSETPEAGVPRPSAERVFPPWPVETLIVWTVVYIALAYPVGYMYGQAIAYANNYFQLGIDIHSLLFIGDQTCLPIYETCAFLLIVFSLKRNRFMLREAWGSPLVPPSQFILAAMLGSVIMAGPVLLTTTDTPENVQYGPMQIGWLVLFSTAVVSYLPGAVVEEIFFRGLLYRAIRQRASLYNAVFISSLIFSAVHIRHLTDPVRIGTDVMLGASAALFLERTRTLTPCVALHFSANAVLEIILHLRYYLSG